MSRRRIEETTRGGIKKYEYEQIDTKKFFELVGKQYCYKSNGEQGYFYMDNVKILYNLNDMDLIFEYVVVEWDKNGNHGRSRPAFL